MVAGICVWMKKWRSNACGGSRMTKWWKCDLQVATPAWEFEMPAGATYDLGTLAGRQAFAGRYMDELVSKGVEVIALADHNCGEWIDLMVEEGAKKGVVVFPGCEITTGTGADGVHLVVIGNIGRSSRDFDVLLGGVLGFTEPNFPRFHSREGGKGVPGSSSKTMIDILESLPDDYLVIAPHVLCENGVASGSTVQGDIRWRALEHRRLVAVDPGNPGDSTGNQRKDSFNTNFRNRALDRFPRLKDLAFVATSDAYSLDRLGARFSWIRMESPSLEGLRQAFLDHSARIICSWDERLRDYQDGNPNKIRHGWIERVILDGQLGNSSQALTVELHPGLNVIIGGRGSGKSTIVGAIRQLYSGTQTLPDGVRAEADAFVKDVFGAARLESKHLIQNSQEQQSATWDQAQGKRTTTATGAQFKTSFTVRVVNQKELFDRVSRDRSDPLAASRSFLAFLDEGLSLLRSDAQTPGSWWRRFDDASQLWTQRTNELLKLEQDISQLPAVRAKIAELSGQVLALDSEEARTRRERNDACLKEQAFLAEREQALRDYIEQAKQLFDSELNLSAEDVPQELLPFVEKLDAIRNGLKNSLVAAVGKAETEVHDWRAEVDQSPWTKAVAEAEADAAKYLEELKEQGINPQAYSSLKNQLASQQSSEKQLAARETRIDQARVAQANAWTTIESLLTEKRQTRESLLRLVSERSGRLRFRLKGHRDVVGWINAIRELLNLRADAFLEDVPQLARWLWDAPEGERDERWLAWRTALATGNLEALYGKDQAISRPAWKERLEKVDAAIRLRLASEVADDCVEIAFLKDGGRADRDVDWQDITQGSPGQRTAAMLGFVLHHGDEPLVLDQPEDDLDTEWISTLVVQELRASRWKRQLVVITHNANIPVNGDAERVIVLENKGGVLKVRESQVDGHLVRHCGAIEVTPVREDIQNIMEGGIRAFIQRERKYGYESST